MDNNMIHIDELFSQRMGGREEKERAGAWLRMSELLDEKLPVSAAQPSNWRRIIGYTAGLLLLATATVGSYQYYHAGRTPGIATPSTGNTDKLLAQHSASNAQAIANKTTSNGLINNNLEASNSTEKTIISKAIAAHPSKVQAIKNNTSTLALAEAAPNHKKLATAATFASTASAQPGAHVGSANHNPKNYNASPAIVSNALVATTNSMPTTRTEVAPAKAEASAVMNTAGTNVADTKQTSENTDAKPALNNTIAKAAKASVVKTVKAHKTNILEPINNSFASSSSTTKAPQEQVAAVPAKPATVMNLLVLHERYLINPVTRKGYYHLDTISRDKIELNTPDMAQANTANSNVPKDLNANENKLPQENKLASVKSGKSSFMQNFNAMIENFKYNFKHLEMTPGVTAGINGTFFGPYALKGFQLGLSSNLTLNDNWNILTEVLYFNRLNNNTINDDYTNFVNPPVVSNTLKYPMLHSFDFSNIHSFELPVLLRYHYRNFIWSAGANFAYNLAINAEEVLNSLPAIAQNEPGISTQPKYQVSDFTSRITLGYVVGVGYQINPNLHLDLRMSRNFWDNAKAPGATLVSNDFFKQPSLQLSIGYEFVRELKMIRR